MLVAAAGKIRPCELCHTVFVRFVTASRFAAPHRHGNVIVFVRS
jgi:hypothetical protein